MFKLLFFPTSTIAYHCTRSPLNGLLQPELSSWPDPGILRASPAHLPRHRDILAALLEWHAPALGLHMGPSAAWNGFLLTPITTVCKHIQVFTPQHIILYRSSQCVFIYMGTLSLVTTWPILFPVLALALRAHYHWYTLGSPLKPGEQEYTEWA